MRSPFNLTPTEYLEGEKSSQIKHEYLCGETYAMVGASEAHNLIANNINVALYLGLREESCKTFISDMKIRIKIGKNFIFYYPDVFVTCHKADDNPYFKEYPLVIFEVLSTSTQAIDKREKRINYQSLKSLKEYVLVNQYQKEVTIYRLNDDGEWNKETLFAGDILYLESINISMAIEQIYERVI